MITPKVQFEKQFGQGVDPWHEKAKRWAKKQKFPISFLALGLIEYLKKIWINTKIKNEMISVDAQIKQLHEDWDEEERKHSPLDEEEKKQFLAYDHTHEIVVLF